MSGQGDALQTFGPICYAVRLEIDRSGIGSVASGGLWAQAGVRRAAGPEVSGEGFKLRRSLVVTEPLLVGGDDGAFVSFVPGPTCPTPLPPPWPLLPAPHLILLRKLHPFYLCERFPSMAISKGATMKAGGPAPDMRLSLRGMTLTTCSSRQPVFAAAPQYAGTVTAFKQHGTSGSGSTSTDRWCRLRHRLPGTGDRGL